MNLIFVSHGMKYCRKTKMKTMKNDKLPNKKIGTKKKKKRTKSVVWLWSANCKRHFDCIKVLLICADSFKETILLKTESQTEFIFVWQCSVKLCKKQLYITFDPFFSPHLCMIWFFSVSSWVAKCTNITCSKLFLLNTQGLHIHCMFCHCKNRF